ncbi:hypothetical protein AAL_07967 [Moelleriella libera RCEF 2490]|uniref:Uncharacterized protein n=1 Tax=Moelleriella libera RCEF 2490 TaxID=1081109 RepID=A0A167WF48_9HYPO|nr:hypothetical protein AAL_07967 [Moelleriella libera RCEF 2490]
MKYAYILAAATTLAYALPEVFDYEKDQKVQLSEHEEKLYSSQYEICPILAIEQEEVPQRQWCQDNAVPFEDCGSLQWHCCEGTHVTRQQIVDKSKELPTHEKVIECMDRKTKDLNYPLKIRTYLSEACERDNNSTCTDRVKSCVQEMKEWSKTARSGAAWATVMLFNIPQLRECVEKKAQQAQP